MEENKIEEKQPETKVEEPKEVIDSYEVVQVPTNHELAIRTPEGDLMDLMSGVVKLLNEVNKIKMAVA